MKKIIISLVMCWLMNIGSAQVTTTLSVNSTPTAVLSEWANDRTVLTYIVNVLGATGQVQAKIKAELKLSDGTIIATKDLAKAPLITLQPGTNIFYAKDVLPLELMMFTGSYNNTLEKTGKLPSGSYQLTVQLVRPPTFDAIAPAQTKNFYLASIQLPILMMPLNNDTLNSKIAQTAITFRWTPASPPQQIPFNYRIQVFEILPYQQPLQALRGNQPLLDATIKARTQYIWRPQLSFVEDSIPKRFIWTIQTLNDKNEPLVKTDGNGESRSEPFIFLVAPFRNRK